MLPAAEEDGPKDIPPIIWKSLKHNSLQYSEFYIPLSLQEWIIFILDTVVDYNVK